MGRTDTLASRKITLGDIVSNDDFWNREFKDTSQLPNILQKPETDEEELNSRYLYNPFNEIVGHEEEKEIWSKKIDSVLMQFSKMRALREKLEQQGIKEDSPEGKCLIDIMAREFPTMPMVVLTGPYGGTKTIQQKAAKELFYMRRKNFGVTGRDYYTKYSRGSPLEFVLVDKPSPDGMDDVNGYEKRKDRLAKIKNYFVKAALWGPALFIGGVVADILISNWWLVTVFGDSQLIWLADGMATVLTYMPDIALPGILVLGAYAVKRHFGRNMNKDLNRLSSGEDRPRTYKSTEPVSSLIGSYEKNLDKSPQFRLNSVGDFLEANEGMLLVENLNALSKEAQQHMSQIIEEKYVDLANLKIRKFCYPFLSFGLNTEKMSELEESLRNRLNYATNLYVKNEIKRNTFNERHFAMFLRYKSSQSSSPPWRADAWKELLDYCSRLAENVNEMRIDRGVISVIERAQVMAKQKGASYVELSHLLEVERDYRSFVQTPLTERLRDFSLEHAFEPSDKKEVGVVRTIISYHDKVLNGPSAGVANVDNKGAEDYSSYIRSEDYIGYSVRTTAMARAVSPGQKGRLNIIASERKDIDTSFYVNSLNSLFWGTDLSKYDINVSVESPSDDESLLCSMYVAIRSAIENRPLRQDSYLAVRLSETGRLASIPRLSSRASQVIDKNQRLVVSENDYRSKVVMPDGRPLYSGVDIAPAATLDELMSRMEQ